MLWEPGEVSPKAALVVVREDFLEGMGLEDPRQHALQGAQGTYATGHGRWHGQQVWPQRLQCAGLCLSVCLGVSVRETPEGRKW